MTTKQSEHDNRTIFQRITLIIVLYLALAIGSVGIAALEPLRVGLMAAPIAISLSMWLNRSVKITSNEALIFLALLMWLVFQAFRGLEFDLWGPKLDGAFIGGATVFTLSRAVRAKQYHNFDIDFTFVSLMMAACTLVYKLYFGFDDRSVRYFLNGPIVFGWMMGLGACCSFHALVVGKSKLFLVSFLLLVLAMLWSESKGPIIALLPALLVLLAAKKRFKSILILILMAYLSMTMMYAYDLLPERFMAIDRFLQGNLQASDEGSIGSRQFMWTYSWQTFLSNPLVGTGLGNWSLAGGAWYLASAGLIYPHNLVLELLSEHGIIGTAIVGSTLLYVLHKARGLATMLATFFLVALQFTGDAAYWPFVLALPLGLTDPEDN